MTATDEDFPETWIRVRPLRDPDGVPASVRVRRAMKCLLRSYGLRAEQLSDRPPEEKPVKRLLLWFDGACEPVNPGGLATWGFVVREDDPPTMGRFLHSGSGVTGQGAGVTNNVAEYHALGHGLRWLVDQKRFDVPLLVRGDSKLVICQMTGAWACNKEHLRALRTRCLELLGEFEKWTLQWVPREENTGADELTRSAWETAAGRPFPERPTKRKRLPGQRR